jgi:hypothetical protein
VCEFCRCIVGSKELRCFGTLGVFDLLEVEEANGRTAPEDVVAVVLPVEI